MTDLPLLRRVDAVTVPVPDLGLDLSKGHYVIDELGRVTGVK